MAGWGGPAAERRGRRVQRPVSGVLCHVCLWQAVAPGSAAEIFAMVFVCVQPALPVAPPNKVRCGVMGAVQVGCVVRRQRACA